MAKSKSGYCAAIDKLPWITQTYFRSSCARRHNLRYLSYLLGRGKRKRTENNYGYRMDFRRSRNFLDYRYYLCDNLRQGHRFGLTARLKKSRNRQGFCPACFLKFIRFQIAGFFRTFYFFRSPSTTVSASFFSN